MDMLSKRLPCVHACPDAASQTFFASFKTDRARRFIVYSIEVIDASDDVTWSLSLGELGRLLSSVEARLEGLTGVWRIPYS
eukprot:gene30189-35176_t